MYNIFFGGMSQYYYDGNELIKDDNVPFTKTVSMISRNAEGEFEEFKMEVEMPGLLGASAEFIPNKNLDLYENEVFKMNEFKSDSILLGHIYGGINSPARNPFSVNQTSTTKADNTIFAVYLISNETSSLEKINAVSPFGFIVLQNPFQDQIKIEIKNNQAKSIKYYLSNNKGQILDSASFSKASIQSGILEIFLAEHYPNQILNLSLVFDDKYFHNKKIFLNN